MSVVVYGSANCDLVYRVAQLPVPGQTVLARSREQHLGGKGNNQAVAAARSDADVRFISAVGNDESGGMIIDGLMSDDVDPLIRRVGEHTGTAMITVDEHGENSIVVDAGAYGNLRHLEEHELAAITDADVLLMQLEVPLPAVTNAARHAREHRTTTVLNAAPMTALPSELTSMTDLLIVNETEACQLLGADAPGAAELLDVAPAVIMTLGSRGSVVGVRGVGAATVDARPVDVTDTTGAGDTFCGAIVAELDRRTSGSASDLKNLVAATEFATAAAALSVQRVGAVPSIPTRAETDSLISKTTT